MTREITDAVLGMCLREPQNFAAARRDGLHATHFPNEDDARLFAAMARADERGQAFDLYSIAVELPEMGPRIVTLAEMSPVSTPVSFYVRALKTTEWTQRAYHTVTRLAQDLATTDPYEDPAKHRDRLIAAVEALISEQQGGKGAKQVGDTLSRTLGNIEAAAAAQLSGAPVGFNSGFPTLDRLLGGGFRRGRVTTFAARSGKGKTALALRCFTRAGHDGHRALYFTVEMPDEQLMQRILASEARVDGALLQNGALSDAEIDRIVHASGVISKMKKSIDDNFNGSIARLKASARDQKRRHGLDIVFIDYAQQLTAPGARGRREHVEATMPLVKELARDLDVAVVLLAQLNRVADNEDEIPGINLLADSAQIEKDSDQVVILHHYGDKAPDRPGGSVLHVAKNRWGPSGIDVKISVDWNLGLFREANHNR